MTAGFDGVHPNMIYTSRAEQLVNGEIVHPDMNVPKGFAFGNINPGAGPLLLGQASPLQPMPQNVPPPPPPTNTPTVDTAPKKPDPKKAKFDFNPYLYPTLRIAAVGLAHIPVHMLLEKRIKNTPIRTFISGLIFGTLMEVVRQAGK